MTIARDEGITAIVLTLDEARHLPACLASLAWANETLVLDSGSRDTTVEIARSAGATVHTLPFVNFSLQRQHGLQLAHTPWVLFVDADERVTEALADEVSHATGDATIAGYWIPRRNVFWGHTMRGGGWWPDHQLRLLRVGRCRYDPRRAVHEVADVDGPTATLVSPLVHLNYESLAEFRARQKAYGLLEVDRRSALGMRVRPHHLATQPAREVARRYIALGGWRDGVTGIAVCALMGWYELQVLRATMRRLGRA